MDGQHKRFRVEHRQPDGGARVLLHGATRAVALHEARFWRERHTLRRVPGAVAVIDERTGVTLHERRAPAGAD